MLSFCHNTHVWRTDGRTDRKSIMQNTVRRLRSRTLAPSHCKNGPVFLAHQSPCTNGWLNFCKFYVSNAALYPSGYVPNATCTEMVLTVPKVTFCWKLMYRNRMYPYLVPIWMIQPFYLWLKGLSMAQGCLYLHMLSFVMALHWNLSTYVQRITQECSTSWLRYDLVSTSGQYKNKTHRYTVRRVLRQSIWTWIPRPTGGRVRVTQGCPQAVSYTHLTLPTKRIV